MRASVARRAAHALAAAALLGAPAFAAGQSPATERVGYANAVDGLPLAAQLHLPRGEGPFPGVVLLSLAGVGDLVERLNEMGWAVLAPERRGIATIEQLLRASFDDLANDVRAGMSYLRARPEVDAALVGIVAQGGEAMAGLLAAVEPPLPAFAVLISTYGLPGDESFRIEQRQIAIDRKYEPDELRALDAFVVELTGMVKEEASPGVRAFRTRAMIEDSPVRLPRNAAFPPDPDDQVRFFASTWWRDLFLFRPDLALARLAVPTLVIMGDADPITPYEEHLPAIERSLAEAPATDAAACLLSGLVQHSVTPTLVDTLEEWLEERLADGAFLPRPEARPSACADP